MLSSQLPLGLLTDLAAYALPLDDRREAAAAGRVPRRGAGPKFCLREVETARRCGREDRQVARSFPPAFQRQLTRSPSRGRRSLARLSLRSKQAPSLNRCSG